MATIPTTNLHDPLLSPEVQAHLAAATARLGEELGSTFGSETIQRYLRSSYVALAETATVLTHLPLLAERFTRERLLATARVEGLVTSTAPVVLFLCVHNAGRSQMALGFLRHHAGDTVIGWSGGSAPGGELEPNAVAAMADRGIDISTEFPKPWTDEVVRAADVVISMGCGDACPIFPGKRYEEWTLADPAGAELDEVRRIRDDIEERVQELLQRLRD